MGLGKELLNTSLEQKQSLPTRRLSSSRPSDNFEKKQKVYRLIDARATDLQTRRQSSKSLPSISF